MNIIMSLWTKPCTEGKAHGYNTVEAMMESIVVSSNVAKKHYSEIHFYTDKLGYEWITPYLDQLPFTKIEVCLDKCNWVPDGFWSYVKVYVYSLQKEPFIHIDNDVFLWDKIPSNFIESNDFIFERLENTDQDHYRFYDEGLKFFKDAVHPEFTKYNYAVNCGVFGCLTQRALDLLPKYIEYGDHLIEGSLNHEKISLELNNFRISASVILEQLFIYSLVKDNNLSMGLLLNENAESLLSMRYSHMVAGSKRQGIVERKIKERVLFKNWD